MSEQQPPENPVPPPVLPEGQFASYYRPGAAEPYGSPERLRSVADGYYSINLSFLACFVLGLALYPLTAFFMDLAGDAGVITIFGMVAIYSVLVAVISHGPNMKIALGKGLTSNNALLASILVGISSVLCCSAFGFILMQQAAATELKKYGLKQGFFGYRKADIEAKIIELNQNRQALNYYPLDSHPS